MNKSIEELVSEYKTEDKRGFNEEELNNFLSKNFKDMNMTKFNQTLVGTTGSTSPSGKTITYSVDVINALRVAMGGNDEWD